MNILSPEIKKYISEHSYPEDGVLYELYRETNLKIMHPRMLSGAAQGQFLQLLASLSSAHSILEIGTYTGYSAICLARGMKKDGLLHTIDIKEELFDIAAKYFKKAGLQNKITQHTGDALKIIPTLTQHFDIIFIDADKKNYPRYFDLCIEKLKPGGLLIADNVLWNGKVIENPLPTDADTQGVLNYNKKVQNCEKLENVLLPLRDGLMLARKIS